MITIYEQGSGKGIGHGLSTFLERFDEICEEHIENKRAKALAFIFYDFQDQAVRRILKDQGVFAKLDRLSGNELSIFYLHNGTREGLLKFNKFFFSALQLDEDTKTPCVVFFKLKDEELVEISVSALESPDLIHGFSEIYEVVKTYVSTKPNLTVKSRAIGWAKKSPKFLSIQVIRVGIRRCIEYFVLGS